MFTGIVEELGAVESIVPRGAPSGPGARLVVRCSIVRTDLTLGASVSVNGVCLTAAELGPGWFAADLTSETLRLTNLGGLHSASPVNLERALAAGARLGGHFVQGHVDATGELIALDQVGGEDWWLRIRVPAEVNPFLVLKGSIAIDGISLTIAALEADELSVAIIPHTYRNTTLAAYRPGARLNIECDILAKHVAKLLGKLEIKPPLTIETLRENGF